MLFIFKVDSIKFILLSEEILHLFYSALFRTVDKYLDEKREKARKLLEKGGSILSLI